MTHLYLPLVSLNGLLMKRYWTKNQIISNEPYAAIWVLKTKTRFLCSALKPQTDIISHDMPSGQIAIVTHNMFTPKGKGAALFVV